MWALLLSLKEDSEKHQRPSVSVIVAARNEADNLIQLIEGIKSQNHSDFELIIINDRSNDQTSEILDHYIDESNIKTLTINELPSGWNGKKYALKCAIKQATNEILLFTDGDCIPYSDQWIDHISSKFDEDTDIVLAYSPYIISKGLLGHLIQFETMLTALQYLGWAQLGHPYMAVGRNWAIRRELYPLHELEEIKHLPGGDDDLIAQKILDAKRTRITYVKNSQTRSRAENNWNALINQKIRHLKAGKFYTKKSQTLLGIFTFSYLWSVLIFLVLILSWQWPMALFIYSFRSLLFYIIFNRLGQKLDTKFSKWAIPFLDLIYPFWYAYLGIRSIAAKQIKWKAESSFLIKH